MKTQIKDFSSISLLEWLWLQGDQDSAPENPAPNPVVTQRR